MAVSDLQKKKKCEDRWEERQKEREINQQLENAI